MDQNETIKNRKHACERCRKSKIRCLVDTVREHGKCKRCYESKEECVFELLAPRQQRKRTDTRLAALEKKVAVLKAVTDSARRTSSTSCSGLSPNHEAFSEAHQWDQLPKSLPNQIAAQHETILSNSASAMDVHVQSSVSTSQAELEVETIPGYIGSDVVSVSAATHLLADFVRYALPEHPVIAVAEEDSFESLRTTKPALLLAIITAASRAKHPALFNQLHTRLLTMLTQKVVMNGERSLELQQTLLIMEIWYGPPDDLKRLNFYLWIQIAATMALQLNLWWSTDMLPRPVSAMPDSQIDSSLMDRWRTALAVYLSMSTWVFSIACAHYADFT